MTLLGIDEARIDSVYVTQEHADGKVTLHFAVDVDCCPEMEDPSGMWNAETEEVNVVYKRKGNTYGLIEPEF